MFGLENLKKYNINKLSVGFIGHVSYDSNKNKFYCIYPDNLTKVVIVEEVYKLKYFEGELCGISPINKISYPYFHDNYIILEDYIGRCMLYRLIPLEEFVKDKTTFNLQELKAEEQRLNLLFNPKEEVNDTVNNPVMKKIMDLAQLIKDINDENIKEQLKSDINALGSYYVEQLIKIKTEIGSDINLNVKAPEYDLVNVCLNRLLTLEMRVKKELECNNLREDLVVLQRNIKV